MLSSAHSNWDGGPPKNFNRENLSFCLKFSVCTSMTSGLMGISSQIFIQTTCREPGVIIWVQFLDGLPQKIWDGEKRSKSGAISDSFRLWSRMSPEGIHKSKIGKVVDHTTPRALGEKKLVNFGPQTKKLLTCILTHPSEDCSGDNISAHTGWCALKFIYALQTAEDSLTHTQTGTGVPPRKMMKI